MFTILKNFEIKRPTVLVEFRYLFNMVVDKKVSLTYLRR